MRTKDSLDESSDMEEPVTDSEDEAAIIPAPEEMAQIPEEATEPGLRACRSWQELSDLSVVGFKSGLTFTDMGRHLLKVVSKSPTPLGRFYRSWCLPTQPTPGAEPTHQRRGDVLPIPPWSVTQEIGGVDDNNVYWVRPVVVTLNFNYTVQVGASR